MVDLNDAGARLASHRAGPVPPVAELRERAANHTRRRRRRRVSGAVVAAVAVFGAVVGVVSLLSRPHSEAVIVGPPGKTARTHPATALPGVPHPAGSTPVDWDQLRLWLPLGWTLTAGPDTGGLHRCWTAPARSVYPTSDPHLPCKPLSTRPSVRVTPFRGTIPSYFARSRINGVTVWASSRATLPAGSPSILDIPSLGVTITAYGKSEAVTHSLGPSALHVVLAQQYPVATPKGWKTITFEGFEADVPASWPTHALRIVDEGGGISQRNLPPPCGQKVFAKPASYLGSYTGVFSCQEFTFRELLQFSVGPTNGLWIQNSIPASEAAAQDKTLQEIRTHLHSGTTQLSASYEKYQGADTVDVNLTTGGRTLQTTIGLGTDPTVAEEVISSLRVAR
jgi:hypothetical protein